MAKLKIRESAFGGDTPETETTEDLYRDWMAEQKRMVSVDHLEFYPHNWELVGRLDPAKRTLLKDDILQNGIREPLHVWMHEGHLWVVSGNERLDIVLSLGEDERRQKKLTSLPCIKKEFKNDADARNHIITVNENRKNVKLSPVDRVIALFPPEDHLMLYADFRGRYADDSVTDKIKSPLGDFILGNPEPVMELMARQKQAREDVRIITGWSERFTEKTVSAAAKKIRDLKKDADHPEASPEDEKKIQKAKENILKLADRIEKSEEKIKIIKEDMARLKREKRKHERILEKFGVSL